MGDILKYLNGSVMGRVVLAVLAIVVMSGGVLFAQEAGDISVVEPPQITSIAGVILFSITSTAIVKKLLGNVPVANSVPVWAYVIVFAGLWTYVAHTVFGTLEGELGYLLWSAVYNGAAASGIREWIYSGPTTPMKDSAGTTADPAGTDNGNGSAGGRSGITSMLARPFVTSKKG